MTNAERIAEHEQFVREHSQRKITQLEKHLEENPGDKAKQQDLAIARNQLAQLGG